MRIFCFILLFCVLLATGATAQNLLKGRVMEYKAHVAVAGARVENQSTAQSVMADDKGEFSIKVKRNDVLVFSAYAYKPDTLVITDFNTKEVFLQPLVLNLKEVTVRTAQDVKIAKLRDPDFHGQRMQYQMDANGNYKGGVTARLWLNNSEEKKRLKEQDLQHRDDVEGQIAKVFTPDNISKYVPLKGNDLDNFIALYRPSVKQYTASGFDLTSYLNNCYKEYMSLPAEKRHPVKISG